MSRQERADEAAHEHADVGAVGTPPSHELWAVPNEFADGATRWANRVLRTWSVELHPLLRQIGHEKAADLPAEADLGETDTDLSSPLYRSIHVQVPMTLDLEEVVAFDVAATLSRLFEAADEWGRQLTRGMLEHIGAVSDEYGNTIDGGGRDFGDTLIDSLEHLTISFDENDEPVMPTLVLHPKLLAKLEGKSLTAEQERRMAEIIERKREEHRASQRRTDLP